MERRTKETAFVASGISLSFLFILLSCTLAFSALTPISSIQPTTASAAEPAPSSIVPFSTLLKGNHSGIRVKQFLIIRSRAEWERLWRSHSSSNLPKQELPMVDFETESVLALFSGEKRTGGYAIEVARVEEDPKATQLKVFYREIAPPPNAIVTQGLTQPFHMIKLARKGDLPVVFLPFSR